MLVTYTVCTCNEYSEMQGCWRIERSLNRGLDRCRGLGLGGPFFLIHARSSKLTRPFEFRTNSGSVSPCSFPKRSRSRSIAFEDNTHPAKQPTPQNKLKLCGFWSLWAHLLNIWWKVRGHPPPIPLSPPFPTPELGRHYFREANFRDPQTLGVVKF